MTTSRERTSRPPPYRHECAKQAYIIGRKRLANVFLGSTEGEISSADGRRSTGMK